MDKVIIVNCIMIMFIGLIFFAAIKNRENRVCLSLFGIALFLVFVLLNFTKDF
jgi:hypothetical protein